jgi:hypothetical protein
MLKLRTKIEAVAAVIILLMISIGSIFATRTITDTSDTIGTMITNSNGKSWTATGANLKEAIKDLANVTGTVWVPAGTILGCNDVRLWSNVSIKGAGMYSTILKADAGFSYGVIFVRQDNDNFSISDLTIDGSSSTVAGANGINIYRASDFTIKNVVIHDCDFSGLVLRTETAVGLVGNSTRGTVDNVFVYNMPAVTNEPFAFNNVTHTVFNNLRARNAANMAFDFHGVKNCTISNLEATHCVGGAKIFAEGSYRCSDVTMTNIVLDDINAATVGFWVDRCNRITISNLHVNNSLNGLRIENSDHIIVDNVQVKHASNQGIGLHHSDHIILNNAFSEYCTNAGLYVHVCNNFTLTNIHTYSNGIYNLIETSKDFTLSDSVISKQATTAGLSIQGCSFFKICNSNFINNVADGIDTTVVACNNYTISNNCFYGNAKAIDIKSTDAYFIISGNICQNGDIIDLSGSVNNVTSFCNKNNNVASITWT